MQIITNKERATFYEVEYNTSADHRWFKHLLQEGVQTVLEIPCGVGRNLDCWLGTGRQVVMADLEPAMVARLTQRIEAHGPEAKRFLTPAVANMCSFYLPHTFELIVVPQGGFQLLQSEEEALAALHQFHLHLAPQGLVSIDLATFQAGPAEDEAIRPSYFNSQAPNGVLCHDWTRELPTGGTLSRAHTQWLTEEELQTHFFYTRSIPHPTAEAERRQDTLVIQSRRYTKECFLALARRANFRTIAVYRNYDGASYEGWGYRMIFLLGRA